MMNGIGTFMRAHARPAEGFLAMPDSLKTFFIFTVFAVLSALVQAGLRVWLHKIGLHIPGISALAWISLMVAGKVRWPGGMSASGLALGLSAADMLIMPAFGLSAAGWGGLAAAPMKYGISGLMLDVFWPIVSRLRPGSLGHTSAVAGTTALALAGKALFVLFSCGFFGIPLPAQKLNVILLHLIFGACAGLMALCISARCRQCPAGL